MSAARAWMGATLLVAASLVGCAPASNTLPPERGTTAGVEMRTSGDREPERAARDGTPAEARSTTVPPATDEPFDGTAPEVWMSGGGMRRLAWDDAWTCTAHALTGIKVYVGELADADVDDLRALARVVDALDLRVAVELGGLLSQHVPQGERLGETSFADEYAKVRRFTDPVEEGGAGGTVDVLEFDGPIRRALWPPPEVPVETPLNLTAASHEFADAMDAWARALPGVDLHLLVNLPNWGWDGQPAYQRRDLAEGRLGWGDYAEVLSRVVADARSRGLPLVRLTLDHPFDYASGSVRSNQPDEAGRVDWWDRAFEVRTAAETLGLSTAVIANEARGGTTSDEAFALGSLAYLEALLADDRAARTDGSDGSLPDAIVVQSWYRYPRTMTPESLDDSLTNLTLRFALRLNAASSDCLNVE